VFAFQDYRGHLLPGIAPCDCVANCFSIMMSAQSNRIITDLEVIDQVVLWPCGYRFSCIG
jgi:hypothetical protein